MGFKQKLSKKIFFNSSDFQDDPSDQPILNFAKRQNLQCELSSIWMNAGNEEEVSESFSFAFYF